MNPQARSGGPTLLLADPRASWREWLRANLRDRDLICLDPTDGAPGVPAHLALIRDGKPVVRRFYGSLDPQRAPHLVIAALSAMLATARPGAVVQLFPYRATPLLRQVTLLIAQLAAPERIVVGEGLAMDLDGFPVGPEPVTLEPALPPLVQHAQRKAQWMRLLEASSAHEVDLRRVPIEGARLGSGQPLTPDERRAAGLSHAVYAERAEPTLFVVSDIEPEDSEVARALDYTGCRRLSLVAPGAYHGLVCSFARATGEDFGAGIVVGVDWASRVLRCRCDAIPPAPVRLLRLGALRVDERGNELGETRPWQL